MLPLPNSENNKTEKLLNWEEFLRSQTDSILLWSIDKGYLNYSGKDVFFHTVDRTSILFFRCILDKQQVGLLVYPANKFPILAPFALEALYSRISSKNRKKILIISDRIAVRNEIKTLFLNFSANNMVLHENFFPVGLINRSGRIINISRIKKAGIFVDPNLLLSANPQIVPEDEIANEIYAVIIEINDSIQTEHLQKLKDWIQSKNIPCTFYFCKDPPCEYAIDVIKAGVPSWGWSFETLIEDYQNDLEIHKEDKKVFEAPFYDTFPQIKNRANGITKVVICIENAELNKLFMEARENYKTLFQKAKKENNHFAYSASKKLLHIIYSLEELIAPLSYIEKEYAVTWGFFTILQKIDKLYQNINILAQWNENFSTSYKASIEQLKRLYDYLMKTSSGKAYFVYPIINEAIKKGKSLAIVSKNAPDSEALKRYLMNEKQLSKEFLETKGIIIISIKELNSLSTVDTCIFYGCPRYYQKGLISIYSAETIGFLTYTTEVGPLKYMLKEVEDVPNLFSFEKRTKSIGKILKYGKDEINKKIKKPAESSKPPRDKIIFTKPVDAEIKGIELEQLIETFLKQDFSIDMDYAKEVDILSEQSVEGNFSNIEIEAVKIKFGDNRIMYVPSEKMIQVYIDIKEEVVTKKAKMLQPDDLLILANNSTSKSLAEVVINKVESHPKMTEVVEYQQSWIHHLQKGVKETGDYPAIILNKLKSLGAKSPRTAIAITYWINGSVIGPRDKNNIKLIGEIYNKPFLINNTDKIYSAVRRLRGLHLSLSRKLGKLIPRAGVAIEAGGNDDTLIDSELDLYLEDFANIITIERIKAVEGPEKIDISKLDKNLLNEEISK